jgi:polyphenol oxidase
MSMLDPLLADSLSCLPRIAHGFYTRHGGVSQGIYASLNCGVGSRDDRAAVTENRARVASHLGARDLVSAHQVHGTTALLVDQAWSAGERPRVDALVTRTPGIAVGTLTADCAPVLFADAHAGVVAAAHAGWRGALAGVLEAAIAKMEEAGAARGRIHAVVGPCISQGAYQVGREFEAEFLSHDPANAAYFTAADAAGRPHFDLSLYVAHRLRRAGLHRADAMNACTFAGDAAFFSYRRSRVRNEEDYGRQISAIVLT